jgi:hypothetical protein
MQDGLWTTESMTKAMYYLNEARDRVVVAYYKDGDQGDHAAAWHRKRAIEALRDAAGALGFNLVPRPSAPVQPAATAEALYAEAV